MGKRRRGSNTVARATVSNSSSTGNGGWTKSSAQKLCVRGTVQPLVNGSDSVSVIHSCHITNSQEDCYRQAQLGVSCPSSSLSCPQHKLVGGGWNLRSRGSAAGSSEGPHQECATTRSTSHSLLKAPKSTSSVLSTPRHRGNIDAKQNRTTPFQTPRTSQCRSSTGKDHSSTVMGRVRYAKTPHYEDTDISSLSLGSHNASVSAGPHSSQPVGNSCLPSSSILKATATRNYPQPITKGTTVVPGENIRKCRPSQGISSGNGSQTPSSQLSSDAVLDVMKNTTTFRMAVKPEPLATPPGTALCHAFRSPDVTRSVLTWPTSAKNLIDKLQPHSLSFYRSPCKTEKQSWFASQSVEGLEKFTPDKVCSTLSQPTSLKPLGMQEPKESRLSLFDILLHPLSHGDKTDLPSPTTLGVQKVCLSPDSNSAPNTVPQQALGGDLSHLQFSNNHKDLIDCTSVHSMPYEGNTPSSRLNKSTSSFELHGKLAMSAGCPVECEGPLNSSVTLAGTSKTSTPTVPSSTITPARPSKVTLPATPSKTTIIPDKPPKNTNTPAGASIHSITPAVVFKSTTTPDRASIHTITPTGVSKNTTTTAGASIHIITPTGVSKNTTTTAGASIHTTTPAGVSKSTTTPGGGSKHTITPAGASKNSSTPAGVSKNTSTLAGVSRNTTTPAGVSKNATTPAGVSKNTSTPAGVSKNTTTPAGVSKNTTTPAAVSKNTTTPAEVSKNTTTPAGVSINTSTPAGVSQNAITAAEVSKSTTTPAGVSKSTITPAAPSKNAITPTEPSKKQNTSAGSSPRHMVRVKAVKSGTCIGSSEQFMSPGVHNKNLMLPKTPVKPVVQHKSSAGPTVPVKPSRNTRLSTRSMVTTPTKSSMNPTKSSSVLTMPVLEPVVSVGCSLRPEALSMPPLKPMTPIKSPVKSQLQCTTTSENSLMLTKALTPTALLMKPDHSLSSTAAVKTLIPLQLPSGDKTNFKTLNEPQRKLIQSEPLNEPQRKPIQSEALPSTVPSSVSAQVEETTTSRSLTEAMSLPASSTSMKQHPASSQCHLAPPYRTKLHAASVEFLPELKERFSRAVAGRDPNTLPKTEHFGRGSHKTSPKECHRALPLEDKEEASRIQPKNNTTSIQVQVPLQEPLGMQGHKAALQGGCELRKKAPLPGKKVSEQQQSLVGKHKCNHAPESVGQESLPAGHKVIPHKRKSSSARKRRCKSTSVEKVAQENNSQQRGDDPLLKNPLKKSAHVSNCVKKDTDNSSQHGNGPLLKSPSLGAVTSLNTVSSVVKESSSTAGIPVLKPGTGGLNNSFSCSTPRIQQPQRLPGCIGEQEILKQVLLPVTQKRRSTRETPSPCKSRKKVSTKTSQSQPHSAVEKEAKEEVSTKTSQSKPHSAVEKEAKEEVSTKTSQSNPHSAAEKEAKEEVSTKTSQSNPHSAVEKEVTPTQSSATSLESNESISMMPERYRGTVLSPQVIVVRINDKVVKNAEKRAKEAQLKKANVKKTEKKSGEKVRRKDTSDKKKSKPKTKVMEEERNEDKLSTQHASTFLSTPIATGKLNDPEARTEKDLSVPGGENKKLKCDNNGIFTSQKLKSPNPLMPQSNLELSIKQRTATTGVVDTLFKKLQLVQETTEITASPKPPFTTDVQLATPPPPSTQLKEIELPTPRNIMTFLPRLSQTLKSLPMSRSKLKKPRQPKKPLLPDSSSLPSPAKVNRESSSEEATAASRGDSTTTESDGKTVNKDPKSSSCQLVSSDKDVDMEDFESKEKVVTHPGVKKRRRESEKCEKDRKTNQQVPHEGREDEDLHQQVPQERRADEDLHQQVPQKGREDGDLHQQVPQDGSANENFNPQMYVKSTRQSEECPEEDGKLNQHMPEEGREDGNLYQQMSQEETTDWNVNQQIPQKKSMYPSVQRETKSANKDPQDHKHPGMRKKRRKRLLSTSDSKKEEEFTTPLHKNRTRPHHSNPTHTHLHRKLTQMHTPATNLDTNTDMNTPPKKRTLMHTNPTYLHMSPTYMNANPLHMLMNGPCMYANTPSRHMNPPRAYINTPQMCMNAPEMYTNVLHTHMNTPCLHMYPPHMPMNPTYTHTNLTYACMNTPSTYMKTPNSSMNSKLAHMNTPNIHMKTPSTYMKTPNMYRQTHLTPTPHPIPSYTHLKINKYKLHSYRLQRARLLTKHT